MPDSKVMKGISVVELPLLVSRIRFIQGDGYSFSSDIYNSCYPVSLISPDGIRQ